VSALILSFAAGTLSVLSPCVLPVLPIIVASALQRHPHGPLALAAGLVVSSTAMGLGFAALGFTTAVDRDVTRATAGALMAVVGVTFLVPRFQDTFARVLAPVADGAGLLTGRLPARLLGQFILGILLGAIWTPCTGPTLAAAVTLAARSESVAGAGAVMLVFGVGAVVPVLIVAYGSRHTLAARSREFARIARVGKPVMGVALLVIGGLTVTGADKRVETWIVNRMPDWLLTLTTRF
jgi:cytochrome c biogenesis protein CcdA